MTQNVRITHPDKTKLEALRQAMEEVIGDDRPHQGVINGVGWIGGRRGGIDVRFATPLGEEIALFAAEKLVSEADMPDILDDLDYSSSHTFDSK